MSSMMWVIQGASELWKFVTYLFLNRNSCILRIVYKPYTIGPFRIRKPNRVPVLRCTYPVQ